MKDSIFKKFLNILLGILLFSFYFISKLEAQQRNVTLIKVGRFWASVTDDGGSASVDFTGGWFPDDYNVIGNPMRWSECYTGGNIYMAASNYNYNGEILDYALFIPNPPSGGTEIVESLKSYTRYRNHNTEVNFEDVTLDWYAEVDPTKMIGNADQTVRFKTRYQNGVEVERTIVAFSNQFHDDYIITELTFTNEGDQTLHDFVIFMRALGGQGEQRSYGRNPSPQSGETWAKDARWVHYYGGRPGDSLRIFYAYLADDPQKEGDNMGGPVMSQRGRMIEAGFDWWCILHASKEPYVGDKSNSIDDPMQPKVTFAMTPQLIPIADPMGDPNSELALEWKPFLTGEYFSYQLQDGIYPGTYHRVNNDELGSPDHTAIGKGFGYTGNFPFRWVVFGPYEFEPGKSIHIAYSHGESGLGIEKMKEVGNKWFEGTLEAPPNLPDQNKGYFPKNFEFPVNATEMDILKDLWVSTGICSLHIAASASKWAYDKNYLIPMSPPPPSEVKITAYGGYVEIKWSDPEAELLPNFAGYRIMRRVSNLDTVFFEEIYRTNPDDKASEHTFEDTTVSPNASYYYYVQSAVRIPEDDMNAMPRNRGKLVYSGRVYSPTTHYVNPPRFSQDDLSKIRIVPNPYNINDPLLEEYGWADLRGIVFYNLPAKVTIKIFTENGDLIQTIEHDSKIKAGSLRWDMLTRNQQVISSGVYIVAFQKPNGEVSYQKLVVVR